MKTVLLTLFALLYIKVVDAQINLPYKQSFDSPNLAGWNISGTEQWHRNSINNNMEVDEATKPANGDDGYARLQTPLFNLDSMTHPELIFYYRIDSNPANGCQPYLELDLSSGMSDGYLQGYFIYEAYNLCMVSNIGGNANTWYRYNVDLSSYSNSIPYAFAFNVTFYGTGKVYIDDVQLQDSDFPEGITPVTSPKSLIIAPNPCSQCALYNDVNPKDLVVTDILGRKIPASFERTSGSYKMQLPENSKGIFLLRDMKAGRVSKFVKE